MMVKPSFSSHPTTTRPFRMTRLLVIFIVSSLWQASHADIGYFWQITDIHLDLNLSSSNGARDKHNGYRPNGYRSHENRLAEYHGDSSMALVESAIKTMKSVPEKQIEFILWTGDSVAHSHSPHGHDEAHVVKSIETLTAMFKREFPSADIYPVLGNLDWFPRYGMEVGTRDFERQLDKLAHLWSTWLPPETLASFRRGGYYSIESSKKNRPRLLILNTLLYYKKNKRTPTNELDPAGQFGWLRSQLMEAKLKNESVFLIGHTPPGNPERYLSSRLGYPAYQDSFTKKYIELVREFYPVIAGQFYGYYHSDSFRMFYKKLDKHEGKFLKREPISYLFIAPSLSPKKSIMADEIGPTNPGLRLYHLNKTSGNIFDYTQYYVNLTESTDDWRILYNFTKYYNLPNISAASLSSLAFALNTKDNPVFNLYHTANSVGYNDTQRHCKNLCRRTHFCVITNVDQMDYDRCIQTVLDAFSSSASACAQVLAQTLLVSITSALLITSVVRWKFTMA